MKHMSLFKHIVTRVALKPLAALIVAGVTIAEPVLASGELSIPVVGEVSLVLGKAYIEKANGARELVTVGTSVNVNDRIETGTNGHVHIRFVDQALVSLRPSSQLEILRYDYRPEAPENSVVKLNLVEGVTRAISGKAAKAARENFRMDTPIAAIGVRGTDFVVSADRDGVRALVNEGAIIIAPYSSECSAAAFGPCSLNALELVGGANQIVQINANTREALMLSLASPVLADASLAPAVTAPVAASETKKKDEGLYTESVTSKAVTQAFSVAKNGASVTTLPPVKQQADEFTPDVAVSAASLTNRHLVWGRFYDTSSELERITVSRDKYIAGETSRKVTVGNDFYALYRTEDGPNQVKQGLDVLGFNLTQAQAVYKANGQAQLMDVTGGILNIDFNQNQFFTNLQLNHAATGNVVFTDSGRIWDGGYFYNRGDTQAMAGAVSLDGTEAGYFFEKTLQSGVIEGLTLWGVKP
jgi:hypothetical protein